MCEKRNGTKNVAFFSSAAEKRKIRQGSGYYSVHCFANTVNAYCTRNSPSNDKKNKKEEKKKILYRETCFVLCNDRIFEHGKRTLLTQRQNFVEYRSETVGVQNGRGNRANFHDFNKTV